MLDLGKKRVPSNQVLPKSHALNPCVTTRVFAYKQKKRVPSNQVLPKSHAFNPSVTTRVFAYNLELFTPCNLAYLLFWVNLYVDVWKKMRWKLKIISSMWLMSGFCFHWFCFIIQMVYLQNITFAKHSRYKII